MALQGVRNCTMLEALPRSSGSSRPLPPGASRPPGVPGETPPPAFPRPGPPLVLASFGRKPPRPHYSWPAVFSLVLHVAIIGLALWLNRSPAASHVEPVPVVFHPAPPRPPPPEKPEAPKQGGGRGVPLPRAVAPDIQPELELSFAANSDPDAVGPTGNWVGGSGSGTGGPGLADGLESGTVIKRSLARDPQELNSAWECDFPEGVPEGKVTVRIKVHVSAAGVPTHVMIVRGGPPLFNRAASECAMRQGFRPALDYNGQPCEGDRQVGILFFRMGSGAAWEKGAPSGLTAPVGPLPDLPVKLDESQAPPDAPPISG
jgi:hypothetical protein